MLTVMILCVVRVVVLFCREAFYDLLDAWSHPNPKLSDDDPRSTKANRK